MYYVFICMLQKQQKLLALKKNKKQSCKKWVLKQRIIVSTYLREATYKFHVILCVI